MSASRGPWRVRDVIGEAASSLTRDRAFTLPACLSLGLGSGLALSVLGLLRLEPVWPPRVRAGLSLDYIRDAGWSADLAGSLWTPAQMQAASLQGVLIVMGGIAALAFGIALAGTVILALIRTVSRRSELALHLALGASRRRLAVRLMAEGLGLGVAGAAIGALLGALGQAVLFATWPQGGGAGAVGGRVWVLVVGLPAVLGPVLPFLVAPDVWRRLDLSGTLTAGVDASRTAGEYILQDALSVGQIAASVALLVVAVALVRAAAPAREPALPGVDPSGRILLRLDLPGELDERERASLFAEALERIRLAPGLEAETLATPGTFVAVGSVGMVHAECGRCSRGGVYTPVLPGYVRHHAVSPGFFRALGVPVSSGREFEAGDRGDAPRVMLVNGVFAASHFERGDPVGGRVRLGGLDGPFYTVVGVVGDIPGRGIGSAARPEPVLYLPLLQKPSGAADVMVRGATGSAASDVRAALAGLLPGPLPEPVKLEAYLRHHLAPIVWLGELFAALGLLGAGIAAFGVRSVMRYRMRMRQREIGLRRAVGARRLRIVGWVVWQAVCMCALGVALGLWSAMLLAAWLGMRIPNVDMSATWAVLGPVAVLGAAGLVGSLGAARQAARIPPAVALRVE